MGTRGVYGFHKCGIDKITYNHFDSYPSELGVTIKNFITNHTIEELNKKFDEIILIDPNTEPTPEQIQECTRYADLNVSTQSYKDWYTLIRKAQGDPEQYFCGLRYMIDSHKFIQDSLFCEWGWIINLDKKSLEIYRGFQKQPNYNRYFTPTPLDGFGDYYNCQLIKEIPLSKVGSFDLDTFSKEIETNEHKTYLHKEILKKVRETLKQVYVERNHICIKNCDIEYKSNGVTEKITINIFTETPFTKYHNEFKKKMVSHITKDESNKTVSIHFCDTKKERYLSDVWSYETQIVISIKPSTDRR